MPYTFASFPDFNRTVHLSLDISVKKKGNEDKILLLYILKTVPVDLCNSSRAPRAYFPSLELVEIMK